MAVTENQIGLDYFGGNSSQPLLRRLAFVSPERRYEMVRVKNDCIGSAGFRFSLPLVGLTFLLLFNQSALNARSPQDASDGSDKRETALLQNEQGMKLLKAGAFAEAAELFRRAIELQPEFVNAYINLGVSYVGADRSEDALACFEHVRQLRPDDANIYYFIGMAHHRLMDEKNALAAYEHAISLNPRLVEAHNGQGLTYRRLGQHELAAEAFNRAVQIDPNYIKAYNNIGVELAELRHYPRAIAAFERAIAFDPSYAAAHYNLAMTYLRLKRRSAALEQFQILKGLDRELSDQLYAAIYQGKVIDAGQMAAN